MCGIFEPYWARWRGMEVAPRLGLFFLGSLLFHVVLLVLPIREWRFAGAAGRQERAPVLQVRLPSPINGESELPVLPASVQSARPPLEPGRGGKVERENEKELELGLPAVFLYEAPEIVSEVPRVISNLKTSGFMVIRLAIDDVGKVESADVVYSNMPFEVSGKLLLLFSQARFKPARYGGKAIADSILLQVDVD